MLIFHIIFRNRRNMNIPNFSFYIRKHINRRTPRNLTIIQNRNRKMPVWLRNIFRAFRIWSIKIQIRYTRNNNISITIFHILSPVSIDFPACIMDIGKKAIHPSRTSTITNWSHKNLIFKTKYSTQACTRRAIPVRKNQTIRSNKTFYKFIVRCRTFNKPQISARKNRST